jgi:hypothetical protein
MAPSLISYISLAGTRTIHQMASNASMRHSPFHGAMGYYVVVVVLPASFCVRSPHITKYLA